MSHSIRSLRRFALPLRLPYQPPLLLWTLAFTFGSVLSLLGADPWIAAVATAAVALAALASASATPRSSRFWRINVALIVIAPALIAAGSWRAESTSLEPDSIAWIDLPEQVVQLQGVVADDPVYRSESQRLLLDATSVSLGAEQWLIRDRVQLQIPEPFQVEPGDEITVRAVITPVGGSDDDYLVWLANQRVAASATARPGGVRLVAKDRLSWWESTASDIRQALNRSLGDALPPPLSGVAQGMITGRRDAIDPDLRSDLNDTSLSHLIVISGSNLTLLTAIVMTASAWLLGRRAAALLAIFAALSYGILIGPDPPVQRAMWMAIVFATAHLLGRGSSAPYVLVGSAGLMVGLEPHILLDLSFQLTLAGTLGIVLLMPALSHGFLSGEQGVIASIRDAALVTFVAGLATMPLIVLQFERAALIGLPANLLVTPLFSWMLLGSVATAVIGLISEAAALVLGWPLAWLPLRWLVLVTEHAAQAPGAGVPIAGFNHWHLLLIYAAVLAVAWRPHRERVGRWYRRPTRNNFSGLLARVLPSPLEIVPGLHAHLMLIFATGAASALAGVLWLSALSDSDDRLRVHFIDVGQGDATLLVTPEGRSVLIDTGERADAILAALRAHLPDGARSIDLVAITHPQSDHGEALWPILEHYDVGHLLVNRYVETTRFGRRLIGLARQHDIATITAQPGQRIVVPGRVDLRLDVLWPPVEGLPRSYLADPNSTSTVLRASFGDAVFLFTGDINVQQELDLVRKSCAGTVRRCDIRADVLKVSHQGSRFSSASLFLETVRPTVAVVSAGLNNPHGHPHPEVVANLVRIGAILLITAESGNISLSTEGRSMSLTTER